MLELTVFPASWEK
jgi:hypothetical protein